MVLLNCLKRNYTFIECPKCGQGIRIDKANIQYVTDFFGSKRPTCICGNCMSRIILSERTMKRLK